MVTKNPPIIALLLVAFFTSCFRHSAKRVDGELVLKHPNYRLDYELDKIGKQLIDTSAVYVYTETESSSGLTYRCLKFDANGNVINRTKFHELILNKNDFKVHPNSVYGGKYSLLDNNRIKLELFYRGEPSPFKNGWVRIMRKGEIVGDTIKIKSDHNFIHNYIRQEF